MTEIPASNKTEAVCSGLCEFTISLKDKLSSKTEAVSASQPDLPHLFSSMSKNGVMLQMLSQQPVLRQPCSV